MTMIKVKNSEYGYFNVTNLKGNPNKPGKVEFDNKTQQGKKKHVVLDTDQIAAIEYDENDKLPQEEEEEEAK